MVIFFRSQNVNLCRLRQAKEREDAQKQATIDAMMCPGDEINHSAPTFRIFIHINHWRIVILYQPTSTVLYWKNERILNTAHVMIYIDMICFIFLYVVEEKNHV